MIDAAVLESVGLLLALGALIALIAGFGVLIDRWRR